ILEELADAVPDQPEQWIRRLAGMFLFPGDDVFKKISVLSGGEKARVALAKMLARPANFLILDEPTNHLDIQAREILQHALVEYSGTIIFISHDRKLINAISTKVVEIQNGFLREFAGDYDYYLWKKAQEKSREDLQKALSIKSNKGAVGVSTNKKEERRQRALLQQEKHRRLKPLQEALAASEIKISGLEVQKAALTEALCQPEIIADQQVLAEKSRQLHRISIELEKEYEAWSELTEQLETAMAEFEADL
ncbi:MAG: ATP-binding cassette domain-containing protein, partial [bacterium]